MDSLAAQGVDVVVEYLLQMDQAALARAVLPVLPVSYTHLRAHETVLDLVCRLLLEKKNNAEQEISNSHGS